MSIKLPFDFAFLEEDYWPGLLKELTEGADVPRDDDTVKNVVLVIESGLSRFSQLRSAMEAGDENEALELAYKIGYAHSFVTLSLLDIQCSPFENHAVRSYLRWSAGQEKAHGTVEDRQREARKVLHAVEQAMRDNPNLNKTAAVKVVAEQIGCDEQTVWRGLRRAKNNGADSNPPVSK